MTSSLDPRRLPLASFAADAGDLSGDWAIAELPRLAESECPPETVGAAVASGAEAGAEPPLSRSAADPARRVRWRAIGSLRPVGGEQQVWLDLAADVEVVLQCQRCLLPLDEHVAVEREIRFVADEATAARLDEETEDHDVLALPKLLDLRELVEDELLLALPLVPRHAVCPQPVALQFGDVDEVESETAHPFASLALLRKDKDGDGGPDIQ